MNESEPCCICGDPAEYRICTDVMPSEGASWLPMPRVYPHRFYCVGHFFTLAEHIQEWTAQQTAREAHRTGLEYIRDHQLQGEPYQPI